MKNKYQLVYLQKHPDRIKESQRKFYQKHQEERKQKCQQYREKNRDYFNNYNKIYGRAYRQKFPEKELARQTKHFAKIGNYFDKSWKLFKQALWNWSRTIQKRDNHICQICGNPAEEVHHILFKKFYPKLSLNKNNGIALCKKCHRESHGRFK